MSAGAIRRRSRRLLASLLLHSIIIIRECKGGGAARVPLYPPEGFDNGTRVFRRGAAHEHPDDGQHPIQRRLLLGGTHHALLHHHIFYRRQTAGSSPQGAAAAVAAVATSPTIALSNYPARGGVSVRVGRISCARYEEGEALLLDGSVDGRGSNFVPAASVADPAGWMRAGEAEGTVPLLPPSDIRKGLRYLIFV